MAALCGPSRADLTLSHTYLNNRNLKYRDNDDSSEENLTLRLRSVEQKTTLRAENRSCLGRWTVREGAELSYSSYTNRTFQRLFTDETLLSDYRTRLGIVGWGLFAGADYASEDKRFTASLGLRADGNDYSPRMARLWHQLSPRASVGYRLGRGWSLSGSAGLYYQLPPYTALGFKEADAWVNKSLHYMRVGAFSAGVGWRLRDRLIVSVEGFYKLYGDIPLSVADGIPLSCKGNDYGVVGNEELRSSAEAAPTASSDGPLADSRQGQSRGFGHAVPQRIPPIQRLLYRSAWDSRFVVNLSGTYDLPRSWASGAPERRRAERPPRLTMSENRRWSRRGTCRGGLITTMRAITTGGWTPSPSWTCASTRPSISGTACWGFISTCRT